MHVRDNLCTLTKIKLAYKYHSTDVRSLTDYEQIQTSNQYNTEDTVATYVMINPGKSLYQG